MSEHDVSASGNGQKYENEKFGVYDLSRCSEIGGGKGGGKVIETVDTR